MSEQLPDTRVLASLLGDAPSASAAAMAERLRIGADVAERCLAALERDGLVERADDGEWRLPELDPHELRELYPAVAILETLALRQAPLSAPRRWRR
jgi:DNA-binding GntR family transcriptional regulator